jgi:hypothetical protein
VDRAGDHRKSRKPGWCRDATGAGRVPELHGRDHCPSVQLSLTNAGVNGTTSCPATSVSAPAACQPTCYTPGADTCTVPFTVATNKSGSNVGVVFTMTGALTFLSGTSYISAATCSSVVGVVGTSGGKSTLTFAAQNASSGYDISLTWCA